MNSERPFRRICIVDDDDAIRESLRLLLEAFRFEVADFPSPNAFLNEAGHSAYDCLLIDLQMPGMSGLELLELLRSRRVPTPAILITGNFDPRLAQRVKDAKVLAVLAKPVSLEDLFAHVERALVES